MPADPMPPTQPATPRPPRRLALLLAASLACNLLIAGFLVGSALTHDGPGGRPRPMDLALGPVARALTGDDRRAVLDAVRDGKAFEPLRRAARQAGMAAIGEAARADPFDPDRMRQALAAQAGSVETAQRAVREALLARLSAMTPAERAAFADRLQREALRPPGRP